MILKSIYLTKPKNKLRSIVIKKNKKKVDLLKRLRFKQHIFKKKQNSEKNLTILNRNNFYCMGNTFFNKSNFKSNKQIHYIFIISLNYSNIFINIINNNKEQICSFSLGYAKFKSLDKITKKYTLLQTIKSIIKKYTIKQRNIALHISSNNSIYNKLIINFLKTYYYIHLIKFYNYFPHNGCRPKKKRRK